MAKWLWISSVIAMAVTVAHMAVGSDGKPPPSTSIHMLWEKHMLEGTFVVMTLEDSGSRIAERHPPESTDPKEDEPTFPSSMSHPISIQKLGEGLFGNGGWVLAGGLLRRVRDGSSMLELYGKKVVRQFPYFPFPPHRDTPQEVGYEFFLLKRNPGVSRATVIHKWTFSPDEVISKNPNYPYVRASLQYEVTARSVTLTVTGLKRPFKDRVDLSSIK
jgi:hypothetical protein